jgi:hypothetical protein
VGEIGINRREYLYELDYVDILLIIRGYQRRQHSGWEQARLIAYNARFCMGAKNPPTPLEWLPFPWEREPLPTDDEINELRELIKQEQQ